MDFLTQLSLLLRFLYTMIPMSSLSQFLWLENQVSVRVLGPCTVTPILGRGSRRKEERSRQSLCTLWRREATFSSNYAREICYLSGVLADYAAPRAKVHEWHWPWDRAWRVKVGMEMPLTLRHLDTVLTTMWTTNKDFEDRHLNKGQFTLTNMEIFFLKL